MNLTREEMGEHGFNGEDGCRSLLRLKKELHEPPVKSTTHFRLNFSSFLHHVCICNMV